MAFDCKRCGKCCRVPLLAPPNMWIGGKLLLNDYYDDKQDLIAKRKSLEDEGCTIVKGCCTMVYFKDGIWHCLVTEVFGPGFTDVNCQNYPKMDTECENGQKRTGETKFNL